MDEVPAARLSARRRALDVLVACVGLVLLLPLLTLLALVVKLSSPGPVLFRQVRLGEAGRLFQLVKFRSMRVGRVGLEVTAPGDPRVTAVGRICRSLSLDELPQLWNVLRGEMTLVGPRPETPGLARDYPQACRWVLQHKPGLTGPAQVRLRDRATLTGREQDVQSYYLACVVPRKVALDAAFLADPSLRRTVAVLLETGWYLLGLPRPGALAHERQHDVGVTP